MTLLLKRLFIWFYCLSIGKSFLLVLFFTLLFILLRRFLGKNSIWKWLVAVLYLCWIAVALYGTLFRQSTGEETAGIILTPFHSYRLLLQGKNRELLRSNFMNILLFYPMGLLHCEMLSGYRRQTGRLLLAVGILFLFSCVIESCQYHFALGLAEADDVIHNSLGALTGALVAAARVPPWSKALNNKAIADKTMEIFCSMAHTTNNKGNQEDKNYVNRKDSEA